MVAVVGRLFQKWFPASPNLSYTFIWDKTDAYNQRVYGLSEAVGMYVIKGFLHFSYCLVSINQKMFSGIRWEIATNIGILENTNLEFE